MIKKLLSFFLLVIIICSCSKKHHFDILNQKYKPIEDFFLARNFPSIEPNTEAISNAFRIAKQDDASGIRTSGKWISQGPGNIGARINTIAVNPQNENEMYVGYSSGGIYKTSDGGSIWESIFDDKAYTSVGSIAIDPQHPNILYAGTGDPNVSGYPFVGDGLYKSSDSGATWTFNGLSETAIISKVLVSATNSNKIYVSAMGTPFKKSNEKGVYRTLNGGLSWEQVLFINDSTGVSDIIMHPSDDNTIYALGWNRIRNNAKSIVAGNDAKVYKTTDGGNNWTTLINGLPEGKFTRLGMAIAPSNKYRLYLYYTSGDTYDFESLYTSTDGGTTWSLHTTAGEKEQYDNIFGGFGWYFGELAVNPQNEGEVYVLGVRTQRYNPTINLWEDTESNDYINYDRYHADCHDIYFSNQYMYLATDGGLYKSKYLDTINWTKIENNPTTQFYRTAYNPHQPDYYYGGAQDNGSLTGNEIDINVWDRIYGGDGFQLAFRKDNKDIIYAESQNGNIVVSENNGINWKSASMGLNSNRHWDMPYIISSHDDNVMYAGTGKMYQSTSGIVPEWQAISPDLVDFNSNAIRHQITTISESPIDPSILYTGSTDAQVYSTLDGGSNWNSINFGLPTRYISCIKASPSFKNRVYVSLTGYREDDNSGHLYASNNNGNTWTNISSNLPPFAINTILVYPNGKDNILFVGTDGGIYVTENSGTNWDRLGDNMPYIPIYDMVYNPEFNQVVAATFAKGIQTFDLKQINIDLETQVEEIESTWLVFPSVTSSDVKIWNQKKDVDVYNEVGIKIETISTLNNNFNLSSYPKGIYYFKSAEEVKKVIKI